MSDRLSRAREFADGKLEPVIDGFILRNVVSVMADFATLEADLAVSAERRRIADFTGGDWDKFYKEHIDQLRERGEK